MDEDWDDIDKFLDRELAYKTHYRSIVLDDLLFGALILSVLVLVLLWVI